MKNRKRGNVKTHAIVSLAVVLVVTIVLGVLGVTGMPLDSRGLYRLMPWLPTTDAEAWPNTLPLGLDLRGGVYVEYSAARPEDTEASFDDLMTGTISVIQARLTDKGYAESTVQRIGTDGLRVEIPDVTDPNAILDLIGTPAKLEFRSPTGETFMDGSMVELAQPAYQDGEYVIQFKLNDEGSQIFAEMTAANIGSAISIYLDDALLIAPTVQSAITGGEGVINGMGSLENAQTVAAQIQSGALPLVLTQQKVDTVSATLGDDALSTSVLAAVIGILLVMVVMLVRYRLNGAVASWALVIYIITLFLLIAVVPGIQLTLPGLAGIVLGIGMAVDANVIIFERFNEELQAGRSLKASVRAGFKNAMSAIVDANITTLIAALVLMFFGTGAIQGFAKTLLLSVITSMFTAVIVTRFLMKRIVALKDWNVKLFTNPEKKQSKFNVKNLSKTCAIVSAGVMLLAVALTAIGSGINLGIDFAGGLSMQYNLGAEAVQSDVENVLRAMNVGEFTVTVQGANKDEVLVRIKAVDEDGVQGLQEEFEAAMAEKYPSISSVGDVNYVGPVAGDTLVKNAIYSVLIAAVLMLIYIAWRFDFNSGVAAVIGLLHDVLMMLAFMVILRNFVQMNSSFIAAMLTIVGYSINNTIVIFDRIRENARKLPGAMARAEVVNISVKESLGRTINTTLTTLITICALYILGVSSIKEFALPIIVGIVSGVYSANMINGYVWAYLEERKNAPKAKKA